MDVKFMSNKIALEGGSFHDFIERTLDKKQTKTASAEKVAEADEAETSGQPQAEAKLVNEPEKEKCKDCGGADNSEAETSGQPQAEAKLVNDPKKEECKEAAGVDNFGDKKAKPFGSDDKDEDDKDEDDKDDKDEKKEDDKDEDEKEEKKAKSLEFVKIAKLNSENRNMLYVYWAQMFPKDYAEAMVKED